jgi:hypothetical protein
MFMGQKLYGLVHFIAIPQIGQTVSVLVISVPKSDTLIQMEIDWFYLGLSKHFTVFKSQRQCICVRDWNLETLEKVKWL